MSKNKPKPPADYIVPLNMNGLRGRMLHMPAPPKKKRHILLIYGHHASLERMFGLAEAFNKYGDVTTPDLPGFGGMQSFYTIHEKPSLDTMADYMAAFVKLRYQRRRVTIIAVSYGFLIACRMLQRHPHLADKVDLMVSVVGFAHHEDFKFSRRNYFLLRAAAKITSWRGPAFLTRHLLFRGPIIRLVYSLSKSNAKFKNTKPDQWRRQVDFETHLWKINDVRTRGYTANSLLTVDLCNTRVKMPLYHVGIQNDRYFDNHLVEQHLNVIFQKVHMLEVEMEGHAPTVIATADEAVMFIPSRLRRVLARY